MDYIKIGKQEFPTLLAMTNKEQEVGLMHREWPPPVMSFIYSFPSINKFWMRNTPSPLDIVFSNNGKIFSIEGGEPNSTKIIGDNRFSDLIVELPAGTCKTCGIKINDDIEVKFSQASLMKFFMIKNGLLI